MRPLIKSPQSSFLQINTSELDSDKLYPNIIREYERKQSTSQSTAFRKLRTYMVSSPTQDQISHFFKDKTPNQSALLKSFSKTNTSFAFDRARTQSTGQFFMSPSGVSPLKKQNFLDDSREHGICKLKKSASQLDTLPLSRTSKQKVPVSHFLFNAEKDNNSIEIDMDSREFLQPLRKSTATPSKTSTACERTRVPSLDQTRVTTANQEIGSAYKVKLDMNDQESSKAKLRRIGSSGTFKMGSRYEPGLGVVRTRLGLDSPRDEDKEKRKFWFKLRNDICTRNRLKMKSEVQSRSVIKRIADNEEIIAKNKECIMVCIDNEGNDNAGLEYCFVKRVMEKDKIETSPKNASTSAGDIGMNAMLYEIRRKLKLNSYYRFLYLLSGEEIFELNMIPRNENVIVISRQTEMGPVEYIVQNELVGEFYKATTKQDISKYSQNNMEIKITSMMENKKEMEKKYNDVLKVLDNEKQVQLNSGQLAYLVNSTQNGKMKEFTDKVHKVFHRKPASRAMTKASLVDRQLSRGDSLVVSNKDYAERIVSGSVDNLKRSQTAKIDEYVKNKAPISEAGKLNVYKEIMGYYKNQKMIKIDPEEPEEKFVGAVDSDEDNDELKQKESVGMVSDNLDGLLKTLKNSKKKKMELNKLTKEAIPGKNVQDSKSPGVEFVPSKEKLEKLLEPDDDKDKKNFMQKNIKLLNTKKNDIHKLYQTNRELFLQNIPKYIKEKNLSRRELHVVCILYKALCEVTSQRYESYNLDDGIDYHSFRNGIYQVFLQSEELAEKVFYKIDCNFSGFLNWEEFLDAMVIIRAKTMNDKIDLFIKIADEDGNGCLSKDEIFNLAKICLGKFIQDRADGFLNDLCDYFTRLIFDSVGVNIEEEIPLQAIKDVITSKSAEADLLAMFCGADI